LHVNGLRRLARLEAVERKDFDQADERFAQALKATLRLSSSSSSAPPVEHGGGSKAAKSKGGMSAGECLAAAAEALSVMAPAPPTNSKARAIAEQIQKRFGR